jgi:hypothetical protein
MVERVSGGQVVRRGRGGGGYLNGPINLGILDVAACVEGAADLLDNVHKDFIAPPAVGAAGVQHRLDDPSGPPSCPWEQVAALASLQSPAILPAFNP